MVAQDKYDLQIAQSHPLSRVMIFLKSERNFLKHVGHYLS